MATVYIPSILMDLTGGERQVEVSGATVREIVDNLEIAHPGIKERFLEGDRLRPNISVAVDGEISPHSLPRYGVFIRGQRHKATEKS
ncbi:MAG: hypothetical protein DMG10_19350 [Acidobacteria bacterium]|nr:MAG: hypothetical protein DMG10_19350 [Acidobacteriota bacterium]